MGINVKATERGYYTYFREIGAEFEIEKKEHFSTNWMAPADRAARIALADDPADVEREEAEAAAAEAKAAEEAAAAARKAADEAEAKVAALKETPAPQVLGDLAPPSPVPSFLSADDGE